MTSPAEPRTDIWTRIEDERRRDRRMRRIGVAAWSVVGVTLLIYAAYVGYVFSYGLRQFDAGAVPLAMLLGYLQPLILVIGSIGLLVAVLTTIGMFVRMRTASLTEIQLRLAALEKAIASDD